MKADTVTAMITPEIEAGPEGVLAVYGPHPSPKGCRCGDRITDLEREIEQLHRLFRAGEICESTYRLHLLRMESQLAILSRAF
jgi:hypothetical protein